MFSDSVPYEGTSQLSLEDRCIRRPANTKPYLEDKVVREQRGGYVISYRRMKPIELCDYCVQKCEHPDVFTSHKTRDDQGKVTCPKLRKEVCPRCWQTGDDAHVLKHCPVTDTAVKILVSHENNMTKKQKTADDIQYPFLWQTCVILILVVLYCIQIYSTITTNE